VTIENEEEKMNPKIAIAVPCHNNLDVLKYSIPSVYSDNFYIVLFDDGSTDGTEKWLKENFPGIHYLQGDGSNWWTGSLAKAINYCMINQCNYIVSLNADVLITPDIVNKLIKCSKDNDDSIIASLVVDINNPEKVAWSGSRFERIHKLLPVYSSRYIAKSGTLIGNTPKTAYEVDEVHGRGVLIPSDIIRRIGNYDFKIFPHYGGDTDFSFRAKKIGVKMLVEPLCLAKVFAENTSLNKKEKVSFFGKLISIKNYLFERKNGEAIFVWWKLYRRHLPLPYFFQSYLFVIILNIYRRLTN
jgi:GT2 family glycosyltransferase